MTHIYNVILTSAPLVFSSIAAHSQERFPTFKDTETIALMPESGVFEAGLFSLEDTAATVMQKLQQFDGKDYRIQHQDNEQRRLRQGNVRTEFKYGLSRTEIKAPRGAEVYKISYTSALLGNRVQTLSRSLRFEDQVSVEALRTNIFEKYGMPTIEKMWSSSVDFIYQYQDGVLLTADEIGNAVPFDLNCQYTLNDMPVSKPEKYKFKRDREIRTPQCQGGMLIQYRIGDRNDLADFLSVRMWNYQLVNQNLLTQDQFLLNSLNQAVGSLSGKEAPKL